MGMTFVAYAQYDSHAPNIYLLHANLDFDDTRPNNVNYGISTPVLNSPDIGSTLARDPQIRTSVERSSGADLRF